MNLLEAIITQVTDAGDLIADIKIKKGECTISIMMTNEELAEPIEMIMKAAIKKIEEQ